MARIARKAIAFTPTSEAVSVNPSVTVKVATREPAGFDPVGRVQSELQAVFSEHPTDRWSSRATSAFLLAVCGSFWILVALVVLNGRH